MNQKNMCYNCFCELEEDTEGSCPYCGYDPRDKEKYPLALPHGTVLNGRYITGRVLGQGGFGVTYIASDWKTKQRVAIKEYLPDTMATRVAGCSVSAYSGERGESFAYGKECFLKEAQTLAEFIGNPNIVRVHSYFEEYGTAYFVMDYVEGTSFQEFIREQGGKIPWQEAEKILLPIMEALRAVHGKGIIHRDVTPDNIFITKDGTVKLLDFGAARYSLGDKSRSLDVVLKHGFAPKEQYTRHGRQGSYTDVYTVAASFYYAVTGRRPPDSIDRLEEDDLVPPSSLGIDIPVNVENAILKGMGVQPADRYQSMAEFQKELLQEKKEEPEGELKGASNSEPHQSFPKNEPDKTPQLWEEKKKKIGIILGCAAGGVVFVVMAVSLILILLGNNSKNSETGYPDYRTVEVGNNHGMKDSSVLEKTATQSPATTPEFTPTPTNKTYTYSCNLSRKVIETRIGDDKGASIDSVAGSNTFYLDFAGVEVDIYCNFSCSEPGMIQSITYRLCKKSGKLLVVLDEWEGYPFDYPISSCGEYLAKKMDDVGVGVGEYYMEVIPKDVNGKTLKSVKWAFRLAKKGAKTPGAGTSKKSAYILPDVAKKYYPAGTFKKMSAKQLRLARNEVYARHGYIFRDAGLKKYFNKKSWYRPKKKDVKDSAFNKYEKANLKMIKKYENRKL